MQLVESYVIEVCRFVPKEQRDDIARDLREAIAEEVYELAESRGEEPNDDDVRRVLRGFGHPLKVAGRYQPQKYLIGPEIYPAMMQTMRVVLTFAVVIQVIAILLLGYSQDWQIGPWTLFWMTFELVVWIVVAIVAVFIAIEYSGEKFGWYEDWSPDRLSLDASGTVSRSDAVTNIVSEGFFLLWWNSVVVLQNFLPDDVFDLTLAPIWDVYFWPLNILFAGLFVLHVYTLMTGIWRRWSLLTEVFFNTALVGLGLVLIMGGELVSVGGQLATDHSLVQTNVRIAILIIMGLTIWDIWIALKNLRGQVYSSNTVELSAQGQ